MDGQSLFELSSDPSEYWNLLDTRFPPIADMKLNEQIVTKCKRILRKFVKDDPLFSRRLEFLDEPLEEGIPTKSTDLIMRPFPDDEQYVEFIKEMFKSDKHHHSEEQKALYLHQWSAPDRVGIGKMDTMAEEVETENVAKRPWWERILGVLSVFLGTCCVIYLLWKCYQKRGRIRPSKSKNDHNADDIESHGNSEGDALLKGNRDENEHRTPRRVTL